MINVIKQFIWSKPFTGLLKQEAMLKMSLLEIGIDPSMIKIRIDHANGKCYVDDKIFDVIFPKVFFETCSLMHNSEKIYKYYFNGYMGSDKNRIDLLKPFVNNDAVIRYSEDGRNKNCKGSFNVNYFNEMSLSKYTLCPHQKNWPHKDSIIWTYRFIEACMIGSIPVVFRDTPLSDSFTMDFKFIYDNEVLSGADIYSEKNVIDNYELARKKFSFGEKDVISLWENVEKMKKY